MSEWPVYPNAPITEALLDIQVKPSAEFGQAQLESFHTQISKQFPYKKARHTWSQTVAMKPGSPAPDSMTTNQPAGFHFSSTDNREVVQIRKDGFTFNRLAPYSDWPDFKSKAQKYWDFYRQLFPPMSISRIALRYLNRIPLPLPLNDFKEYLCTTPEIAPDLPQGLSHFYLQMVVPFEKFGCLAVITETMGKAEDDRLPVILDVEVYCDKLELFDEEDVWARFEKLRNCKNEVFTKSLTDAGKELIK